MSVPLGRILTHRAVSGSPDTLSELYERLSGRVSRTFSVGEYYEGFEKTRLCFLKDSDLALPVHNLPDLRCMSSGRDYPGPYSVPVYRVSTIGVSITL
jgi:hypothetical protein